MNKRKLKSTIVLFGDNLKDLALYLGITQATLSKKLNSKQKGGFNQIELFKMKQRYKLNNDDFEDIFFSEKVS